MTEMAARNADSMRSWPAALVCVLIVACGSAAPSSTPAPAAPTPSASPTQAAQPTPAASTEALLAFEWFVGRDHKDVVTIRQDGTNREAVAATVMPGEDHGLVDWSPDGQAIAFVSGEWYLGTTIWTVRLDGSDAEQLIGPSDECRLGVNFPAYSPDGTKLLYVCEDGTSGEDPDVVEILKVLDLATATSTTVVTVPLPDELLSARWSPDGLQAVVELRQWDTSKPEAEWIGSQIATVPIAGGEFNRLTAPDMWALDPDWSWSRNEIAFGTYGVHPVDTTKTPTIYTIHPDGGGLEAITNDSVVGATRVASPRWTPYGERLLVSIGVVDGNDVVDVQLAFLDLDGTITHLRIGSENLSGVGARLQPLP